MKLLKTFTNGIIAENPVFRLLLCMCSALAVTTSAVNSIGMGVSVTFVLVCSNVIIALLRKVIPAKNQNSVFYCRYCDVRYDRPNGTPGICSILVRCVGRIYSIDCR